MIFVPLCITTTRNLSHCILWKLLFIDPIAIDQSPMFSVATMDIIINVSLSWLVVIVSVSTLLDRWLHNGQLK